MFCNGHRLPEDHECEFNHKEKGQKKLETEMVKVEFQKIQGIWLGLKDFALLFLEGKYLFVDAYLYIQKF